MAAPPYRLSKPAFEEYERHINKIVEHFPRAVPFQPLGVTSDTLSRRLRYAIRAGLLHKYSTNPRFYEVGPRIVVREWPDGTVVAGGVRETRYGETADPLPATNRPSVVSPSPERLRQLFQLLSEGLIQEFRVSGVDPAALHAFEGEFDVAITQEGDTYRVI